MTLAVKGLDLHHAPGHYYGAAVHWLVCRGNPGNACPSIQSGFATRFMCALAHDSLKSQVPTSEWKERCSLSRLHLAAVFA